MDVVIRKYQSGDFEEFCQMVLEFYGPTGLHGGLLDAEKIKQTVDNLTGPGCNGGIYFFDKKGETTGYAIVNWFWSNEFSGHILYLDELFVKKPYRGQGIGGEFLGFLEKKSGIGHVGAMLETSLKNGAALHLYKKHGFSTHHNYLMFKQLEKTHSA